MDQKEYKKITRWKYIIGFIFVFELLAGGAILYKSLPSKGASYGWLQTTWSGGISTTATSTHTTEQANPGGWSQYFSKDSNVSTSTAGQLTLTANVASSTDTVTGDFAGLANNTYVSNGTVYLKKPNGVNCSADSQCQTGCCVGNVCSSSIGASCEGGIVFQISSGIAYIVSTVDLAAGYGWGCGALIGAGAQSDSDGKTNTSAIIAGCSTDSLARRCASSTENGYTDWYLPAKNQLNTVNGLKSMISFSPAYYWSSTEGSAYTAWFQEFPAGTQINAGKNYSYGVFRCIRQYNY